MIGVAELFRGVFKQEVEDLTPHYVTIVNNMFIFLKFNTIFEIIVYSFNIAFGDS